MAKRRCLQCPAIGDWQRTRGCCPQHQQTTKERGYGAEHQRESRAWKARIKAGEHVLCWRCGEPITDPDDCHLGHDDLDRSITRGPEHGRACNLRTAGRISQMR